jgi:hypothetical protein
VSRRRAAATGDGRHTRQARQMQPTLQTPQTQPTQPTLGATLRRAGVEWAKEVGPTVVVLGGLCLAGIGAIQYAEGTNALAVDTHLRASGALTTGEVVEVDSVHRTFRRGNGSTSFTPTTQQVVDGREFTTRLDNYDITNDRRHSSGDVRPGRPANRRHQVQSVPAHIRVPDRVRPRRGCAGSSRGCDRHPLPLRPGLEINRPKIHNA